MNLLKYAAMTNNDITEKLKQVISNEPSKWHEDAQFRSDNKKWLNRSQAVALKVLRTLREKKWSQKDLAEEMKVSAQLVNKWVKGKVNFTFETICKLEDALNVELINVSSVKSFDVSKIQTIELPDYDAISQSTSNSEQTRSDAKIIPFYPSYGTWGKCNNDI